MSAPPVGKAPTGVSRPAGSSWRPLGVRPLAGPGVSCAGGAPDRRLPLALFFLGAGIMHFVKPRAYESIAKIVADGQASGDFRGDVAPMFASMSFYGAIEQLLSGWIFGTIPASDTDFDQARDLLVTTICDGLEPRG